MKDKKIIIGISGGIAIYKVCSLVRLFIRNDIHVKIIMTKAATKLISPLTFQALTGSVVYTNMFKSITDESLKHISLADWCDIFILAPATANTIGKIANGIADNLLTTTVMALPKIKPVVFAPAMNKNMWEHSILQRNIKILNEIHNYHIIEPEIGLLAIGYEGKGKLANVSKIFDLSKELLEKNDETTI